MTGEEFAKLPSDLSASAEAGDGGRFAGHFTEDAVYYDYISMVRIAAAPTSRI